MDQFHQYLLFAFTHLTVIIEVIFAVILFISVFWLVNNLRSESEESGTKDLKEIEEALRRVLASASPHVETAAQAAKLIHDEDDSPNSVTPSIASAQPLGAVSKAALSPNPGQLAELEALKGDLDNKSKKMAEVQSMLDATKLELELAKKNQAQVLGE